MVDTQRIHHHNDLERVWWQERGRMLQEERTVSRAEEKAIQELLDPTVKERIQT